VLHGWCDAEREGLGTAVVPNEKRPHRAGAEHDRKSTVRERPRGRLGRVLAHLGPGLIAGAADDDPSGIVAFTQAGARFQYGLLWTALLQFPLLAAMQIMVARIGLVTGRDFTRVLGDHYPRVFLWGACTLLFLANTFTAGADVAGVAASVQLLSGISAKWIAAVLAAALPVVLVLGRYHSIARTMKWLTLALFGYVAAGLLAKPDWSDVLHHTFLPSITHSRDYLLLLVAISGGTISPYVLVWQSAEEVEEQHELHKKPLAVRTWAAHRELRRMHQDTIFGMGVGQLIEYFVFVAAGTVIFPTGLWEINTARDAAIALHPIGRGAGEMLFAVGMIATGLVAIPTLTVSSAYAISAAARWPAGINEPARKAKRFNATLTGGVLIAGAIAIFTRNPMRLLVASQVLNGVLAPPLLVLIMMIANNAKILGARTNGRLLNALGVATLLIMGIPAVWLIASWLMG
jgi:NRAMP (natural resistance-associated macrophage protein)-like metal ion transporter